MTRPLVLTSSPVDQGEGWRIGDRPRIDYVEVARNLDATVLHPPRHGGLIEPIDRSTRLDWAQAVRARARRPTVFLSFSERIGIPLALARPGAPHVLLAHRLTSRPKLWLQRALPHLHRFAVIVVLCRTQERFLREVAGVPASRVRFLYDKVDHRFFTPPQNPGAEELVVSVGRERRDYATLIEAVRPLGVRTVLVTSSPWSTKGEFAATTPESIETRRNLTYAELRELYARARVIVVPLEGGLDYAAGVNGVLEAMAMAKPVVVTRTPGIADYVEDGADGRLVAPGCADALRSAIVELLEDEKGARRLGARARATVEAGRNLDELVDGLVDVATAAARRW